MAIWREWTNRLRYLRRRTRIDDDVEQEIRFHLDARIDELEAFGLTRHAARRQAYSEFGSVNLARDDSRAAWQIRWLEDAIADVRYTLRTFRRSPGFVITAVLSLALGIGATSAIFTALDAVLWRTLPVVDPDSLVLLSAVPAGLVARLPGTGVFSDVVAMSADGLSFSDGDRAERIVGEAVSPTYFTMLGVRPILGQAFSASVQQGDWAPEAVLSHGFWTRRFGADPAVIGRTIRLNTVAFTVVGVSPPGFTGLTRGSDFELRIPRLPEGRELPQMQLIARGGWIEAAGRLAPGVDPAQAEAAASTQLREFLRTTPERRVRESGIRAVHVRPGARGTDELLQPFHATLYVLLILAATVLLIACTNVASLLVARATARERELAVRLSIGAGRLRLVRQMLVESLLLSVMGAVAALGVVSVSSGVLPLFVPQGHIPIVLNLAVNGRVLLFTLAVSTLTAFAFGLLPALHATQVNLASALKTDSTSTAGAVHGTGARRLLVTAQIAFSIVLLIATGQFVRTLFDLRLADYQADPSRVLLFTMKPQPEIYTPARKLVIEAELLRRVSQLPAVQSAALAERGPLSSRNGSRTVQGGGRTIEAQPDWVSPGLFDTIGVPRLAGRDFTTDDRPGSPYVAIVSRSLARALFDDGNPIGRTLQLADDRQHRVFTVVGVVRDTHYADIHGPAEPVAWFTFQADDDLYMPTLHVRGRTADTAGLIAAVRSEFDQVDRGFPVFNIKTLEARVNDALGRERMIANISASFGVLALLLAAVGIYGVLAYSVVRRRREIGIRVALGSTAGSIMSLVAREGLLLAVAGSLAGIAIAMPGSRILAHYLPGISSVDLSIVFVCVGAMLVVAAAALCVPTLRACLVDPLTALRQS
ncbi:MAG TPA: ABC transporter permease [Vicinamibacterales bacterium]|jgi:predicted permease|nr:ABC transporter permease [Vicinamibacterales bacterium]